MKVFLVYKKSLLELYFKKNHAGLKGRIMQDKELCACMLDSDKAIKKSIQQVEKVLKSHKISYKKIYRGCIRRRLSADIIICVGGDGTLLNVAHYLDKGILMLVNADPGQSEAYYSCCVAGDFEDHFKTYMRGKHDPARIHQLSLRLNGKVLPEKPVNDILVAHENPASVTRYIIQAGSISEEHKSSGIWVSAPGGTTAAILSAGGSILPLGSKNFEFLVRELYKARLFKLRKGILQPGSKLIITSRTRRGRIYVDGSHINYPFGLLDRLEVGISKEPLCIMGRQEIEKRRNRF